jgi:hypothetical protein
MVKPPLFRRNDVIVHCYLARLLTNCTYQPGLECEIDKFSDEVDSNMWWIELLD